jgi:aldose 1-epimerase
VTEGAIAIVRRAVTAESQHAREEKAMTSSRIGLSRCQPLPAPDAYSVDSAWRRSSAASFQSATGRHGREMVGRSGLFNRGPFGRHSGRDSERGSTGENAVSIAAFGEVDGKPVQEIRLRSSGAEASIISFGASLRDLSVALKSGKSRRVVLGYETLDGYRNGKASIGATCGRIANRIAGGRFSLDGKDYQLATNEGGTNHLHGGNRGMSQRAWEVTAHAADSVTLRLVSPAGEENYPGTLEAFCTYRLLPPATIRIEMTATADAATLINLVNHSYFTLAEGEPIWDHSLEIAADLYTPLDGKLIPTGEIARVAGTPFDFRKARPIRHMENGKPFDYDLNFVLRNLPPLGSAGDAAVRAVAPAGDLALEVATDQPGVQLYTGAVLREDPAALRGQKHFPHAGFCLETQIFPDAIHQRHFPSSVLRPGEVYRHIVEYRFIAL